MDLPPFTLGRGLAFGGDPFFLVAACWRWRSTAGAWCGCGGAATAGRWGARWPSWLGVLTIGVTMCTKLNDYGMVMFSVHMVQHMVHQHALADPAAARRAR